MHAKIKGFFCNLWVVYGWVDGYEQKLLIAPPVQASDTKPAASSATAGDQKLMKRGVG